MGQQPLGSLFQCLAPYHPHTSCSGSQEQRLAPITKGKASKQTNEQKNKTAQLANRSINDLCSSTKLSTTTFIHRICFLATRHCIWFPFQIRRQTDCMNDDCKIIGKMGLLQITEVLETNTCIYSCTFNVPQIYCFLVF